MIEQNYRGYLIAAHPKKKELQLRKSVYLIVDHDRSGAIGLQVNKAYSHVSFNTVMENVGLHSDFDQPLYEGGPEGHNRVHIIHSLDWYTSNTENLNNHIGVSHDLSVLTAISEEQGPEYFRAVAGFKRWAPGELEAQILAEDPWTISDSWNFAPADLDLMFESDEVDQWHDVIDRSSRLQVAYWF